MVVKMTKNGDSGENILYETIVNDVNYESLPRDWQLNNIDYFSEEKTLFDYQNKAIKNIINFLKYFYEDLYDYPTNNKYDEFIETKKKLYDELLHRDNEIKYLGLDDRNKAVKELLPYYDYHDIQDRKVINFYNFVNRAGFWMATASGKTLLIVKLIELLDYLMNNGKIPKNDILFLTYTDDQMNQFRNHVAEYNSYHSRKIILHELRDYDKVKYGAILTNKDDINIFFYRSDLISNETKEKVLSYKDFENDGKWYLILDEAHKGDKEDSKRQVYYSFITRFGFLFNFSATFTDPWDIITTVFNFNLDHFIGEGYGKNLYVSQKNIDNFKKFKENEKEKIVLKTLILLTAIKMARERISSTVKSNNQFNIQSNLYHNPMMVIYGNSVHKDESDLQIIFNVLEKIAVKSNISNYNEAKDDLLDELQNQRQYAFDHGDKLIIDENFLNSITYDHILKYVYNSETNGKIEIIKIPMNEEELILKLKTSAKPFALIKIGNIGNWVKEKLKNYEINESYDNQSYFQRLNKSDSPINILLGSRSFYEGWDSNRPNVMMFINIGTGDSRKFVLQAIGRGERIEPLKDRRKRLKFLANEKELAKIIKEKPKDCDVSMIESLFVFGTDVENIKKIMDLIKYERSKSGFTLELKKNKYIDDNDLLIPVYGEPYKPKISEIPKFSGNYELLKKYINEEIRDDKIIYTIYSDYLQDLEVSDIPRLKEYLSNEHHFDKNNEGNAFMQTIDLIRHIKITLENIDTFKKLENEIIHFKEINAILDEKELKDLKNKIDNVIGFDSKKEQLDTLTMKLQNNEISLGEFQRQYDSLKQFEIEEFQKGQYKISIKNISNHYYIPVMIAEDSKEDLINHIIKEPSEKKFIEDLENYIKIKSNEVNVDYWFFSKIDQTTDKIYIPYYNKKNNGQDKFYPDFIFWLKKDNDYYIIFVDPKSINYTDYGYKVEGYSRIFEENNNPKRFKYNEYNIYVYLLFYTDDKNKLSEDYQRYWCDSPEEIFSKLNKTYY